MSLKDLDDDQIKAVAEEFALDGDDDAELRAAVENLNPDEVTLSFPQWAEIIIDEPEEEDDEEVALVTSDTTPKKGAAKKTAKKATAKKAAAKTAEETPVKSKTVVPDDRTLLKMTRNNPVYEVRGYRFTRQMPYVFVKTEDVDFLIEVEGGFAVAKPTEVEAFFN